MAGRGNDRHVHDAACSSQLLAAQFDQSQPNLFDWQRKLFMHAHGAWLVESSKLHSRSHRCCPASMRTLIIVAAVLMGVAVCGASVLEEPSAAIRPRLPAPRFSANAVVNEKFTTVSLDDHLKKGASLL